MDGIKNKLPKLDEPTEKVQVVVPDPVEEEVFDKTKKVEKVEKVEEVEKVTQAEEVTAQAEPIPIPKKEKKKRVASDKLKAHLAIAREKSLATRKKNKEAKLQQKNLVKEVVKETLPPPTPTQSNFTIDYEKIIEGVSNRLMKDFEEPAPQPPPRQIRQPIIQEQSTQNLRQQERNEAQLYYKNLYEGKQRKDLAMNIVTKRGGVPKLSNQPYSDDVWEKCFRRGNRN